jgi:hypothetical protein
VAEIRKKGFGLIEIAGLVVPLAGNLLEIMLWAQLFGVPPGTSIRPMGAAAMTFVVGICAGIAGVIVGGMLVYRGRILASILCVLFSFTPIPLGIWLLRAISAARHLELSP